MTLPNHTPPGADRRGGAGREGCAMGEAVLILGDCRSVMATLAEGSVDLIVTDPPYFRVKDDEEWDRQWPTVDAFLVWISELCGEWRRVLAPNGSLYVFASPEMATRVECKIGETFEVLNRIRWIKEAGWHQRAEKDALRSFLSPWEEIIFAEQPGSDSHAKGEAGYDAKCDELRGFVFADLLQYLLNEFERSRLSRREVDDYFDTANVSQYWLQALGFIIPTAEKWAGLQALRPYHFCREYEDLRREYEDLRREYEDLRREYEDLRRPFSVSADVPYTDVWDFPTVPPRPGKHPCEKPLAMIEHIVAASSRPGDLVLDCFAGSGVTGQACRNLGRRCILIEKDPHWVNAARTWLDRPHAYLPRERTLKPMPLFAGMEGQAS